MRRKTTSNHGFSLKIVCYSHTRCRISQVKIYTLSLHHHTSSHKTVCEISHSAKTYANVKIHMFASGRLPNPPSNARFHSTCEALRLPTLRRSSARTTDRSCQRGALSQSRLAVVSTASLRGSASVDILSPQSHFLRCLPAFDALESAFVHPPKTNADHTVTW